MFDLDQLGWIRKGDALTLDDATVVYFFDAQRPSTVAPPVPVCYEPIAMAGRGVVVDGYLFDPGCSSFTVTAAALTVGRGWVWQCRADSCSGGKPVVATPSWCRNRRRPLSLGVMTGC